MEPFRWRSESDEAAPARLEPVDDRLTADEAMRRVGRGEHLLYGGDFRNAKQLLSAMGRRLEKRRGRRPPGSALEAFRAERRARAQEHATLSRVVVALDRAFRLQLAHAPDVAEACRQVWGEADADITVVPLKTLLGMLGAAEWRRRGLAVPGLAGALTPHWGVYLPTRTDYVELFARVGEARGKRVFDVGTGTGVLAFLLLQRGAASAVGTDVEPRAVACATENAQRLGLASRFTALSRPLFPEGAADLVVCNPPWLPEAPKNRVDGAVFDEGSAVLLGFLEGLAAHLAPGGVGLLVLSDLAVLLGLREAGWLEAQLERRGLEVRWTQSVQAKHGRAKDEADALHAVRSREVTTLYALAPRATAAATPVRR